ncbi:uncharacterized protein LOC113010341 isoform X2 [Astatotilapia calliptera]|uniref:uncharacterized protein LOC113010341 isoform X2 n=1 Tax=Astatotilapia calliptera TaxID=8154 RepID=UPI000E40260D|nr:uncharacterized protein LOC113010341 isoform X2 [Astatotilapia calliptera]
MQQIYRHSNEHIEVYTTVFSPQVCRSRTRTRYVGAEKMAVARIQVQFKEDEAWWFGRLKNGDEGYFPAACVELLQGGASSIATPTLLRRGSVPAVVLTAGAPCGCTSGRSTPKLLRKNSIRRPLGLGGPSVAAAGTGGSSAAPQGSPSLLHRVLAKSRRKSCPHLTHIHHPTPDTGSVNTAFQPD